MKKNLELKEIRSKETTALSAEIVVLEKKLVRGRYKATIKAKKKVIVTLKKGQKIEGFEVKE